MNFNDNWLSLTIENSLNIQSALLALQIRFGPTRRWGSRRSPSQIAKAGKKPCCPSNP